MGELNPQDLANTAWAFATLAYRDAELFGALAQEAKQRVGEFNPQKLANTAWAFASLGYAPPALLDPISILDAMERRGNDSQLMHYQMSMNGLAMASQVEACFE